MGFFSKKKDESSNLPPAPMPLVVQGMDKLNASPMEVSRQAPYLNAPTIPSRNSLDEIKSQVTSTGSMNNPVSNVNQYSSSKPSQSQEQLDLNDDSLFDFSTLDLEGSENNETNNYSRNTNTNSNNSLVDSRSSFNSSQSSFIDKNAMVHEGSLSFVSNRNKLTKVGANDNLFVTTSQFKSFLEIIEQVRSRVKDSSDRHLRLLDIKSEEDNEYENLRKDFQYIEDKLYEVDSLIFDR